MTGTDKLLCQAAAALLLLTVATAPANAQFGGGDTDMMTRFAPMLEMMKAKMGKRRFGTMMQTMGPMMSRMMENGGDFGLGGNSGGFGGGSGFGLEGYSGAAGDGFMGMLGGNGGEITSMLPQLVSMANMGGGHRHRRHRRR